MRLSFRKGLGFGLTSGVITTLGLIVGLNASTGSLAVILSGIIVIAVADALSDSLAVHISEESTNGSERAVWESTGATLVTKFLVAASFILPVALLPIEVAIPVCIVWGLSLIAVFSHFVARHHRRSSARVIIEHLAIAILVIVATHLVGQLAARLMG